MDGEKRMDCDVLVVGGTLEGCAAALCAARAGNRVVLAEQSGSLGGMSTNGLHAWFLPAGDMDAAARGLRGELLTALGAQDASGGALYRDQQLKLVLARLLSGASVRVLTHVFTRGTFGGGVLLHGKTGPIRLCAGRVLDATALMDVGGAHGLATTRQGGRACLAAKLNNIDFDGVRRALGNLWHEKDGQLAGTLDFPLQIQYGDMLLTAGALHAVADKHTGELILSGFGCELAAANISLISRAMTNSRRFAYALRDAMRQSLPGFEAAHIIQVAPLLDVYGLRALEPPRAEESGLTLVNNGVCGYDSNEAIMLGVKAARG